MVSAGLSEGDYMGFSFNISWELNLNISFYVYILTIWMISSFIWRPVIHFSIFLCSKRNRRFNSWHGILCFVSSSTCFKVITMGCMTVQFRPILSPISRLRLNVVTEQKTVPTPKFCCVMSRALARRMNSFATSCSPFRINNWVTCHFPSIICCTRYFLNTISHWNSNLRSETRLSVYEHVRKSNPERLPCYNWSFTTSTLMEQIIAPASKLRCTYFLLKILTYIKTVLEQLQKRCFISSAIQKLIQGTKKIKVLRPRIAWNNKIVSLKPLAISSKFCKRALWIWV